jgi:cytochrome P450
MNDNLRKERIEFEYELASLPIERLDVARPRLFQIGLAPRYLERLRREAPIHFCAEGEFGSAYWSITRHADIEAIELDPATFSSDHYNGGISLTSRPDEPQFLPAFIAMDPPRHGEQRRAVAPAFSPGRLLAMAEQIRAWSAEILDQLPIGQPFDWVDRVSIELTARTLALLLGYPQEHARDLIHWSGAMTALPGDPAFPTLAAKLSAMQACFDTFDGIWAQRQGKPAGTDLVSMLAANPQTRVMSRQEVHGNIMLLIVGGNDTTRNGISGSVLAFDLFPRELEKLRARPTLIASLTPEVLRWQTPIAHMRRTATRDVTLSGTKIRKGEKVILWYLSGNRDEEVFERGDDFVLDRPNARRHLAFGVGIHRCVGARLADLQIRMLWEEIMKRFPRIVVAEPPQRVLSTFMYGYTELRVIIPERFPNR